MITNGCSSQIRADRAMPCEVGETLLEVFPVTALAALLFGPALLLNERLAHSRLRVDGERRPQRATTLRCDLLF
jgi:hypothetical protein